MRKGKKMSTNKDTEQDRTRLFLQEVEEEVRYDNIRKAFHKWKWALISLIAVLMLGVTLLEGYKAYRMNVRMADSNLYEQAAVLNAQGKSAEAEAVYQQLFSAKTDYKYLAQMRVAGIYFDQGKKQEGIEILTQLRQEEKLPAFLKAVVDLSYVGHQIENGSKEDLQNILNVYMMPGNSFYGTATELSALLLLQEGKTEAAKKLLMDTISSQMIPEAIKLRLEALLSVIEK